MVFKKKILIVGYGSVARCLLPLLFKHLSIPSNHITIIDSKDKTDELAPWIKKGIKFFQRTITPLNLARVLSEHLSSGDVIIDLSWNIECIDILAWCHENNVLYINSSVENWDPFANISTQSPYEKSLYHKQEKIRAMANRWNGPQTTAIIDHGANPGLVSHFMRKGLVDIACTMLQDNKVSKKIKLSIEEHLSREEYAHLSKTLEVKVIHISEHDTQITNNPKQNNEFVGTWSIEAMHEESLAPAEFAWGTHETSIPLFATFAPSNKQQIFLSQMGMNTWIRSWVPDEEIIGMVIRHAEIVTISHSLSVEEKGKIVYSPTVNYAYMPCNESIVSLHELRCRNYELQSNVRILNDEITDGADKLGALIMGHRYHAWWTGSILSIHKARKLIPHQNATTLQVAIGVIAAFMWMIQNPNQGVCMPDDLPYEPILATARPYLGEFISKPVDWNPLKNYQVFFKENPTLAPDRKNIWSFNNFLFCS